MPLQQTSGAASYDAFGGGVPVVPKYIEDAFSCFLYSGTSANQIVTNGINLSTDGGLVWIKRRSSVTAHALFDTNRGVQKYLQSNTTDAEGTASTSLTAFFTDGFRVGADSLVNEAGETYVSWTLKQQPKFFDVVTGTGTGTFSHNLGAVPGCIIFKTTNAVDNWYVAHNGLTGGINGGNNVFLNRTDAQSSIGSFGATSTTINTSQYVGSSTAWVAYLFAHNAGGFGLSGTDNVISCGSYTGDDSDNGSKQVNLGFEPQWVLIKSRTDAQNWFVVDNMRGMTANGSCNHLRPNLSGEEQELALIAPTATGFNLRNAAINTSGSTYIYIAIRRGPMRTPTTGTSVFAPLTRNGTGTAATLNGNAFPIDMAFITNRDRVASTVNGYWDRLRGSGVFLNSNSTNAEGSNTGVNGFDVQDGLRLAGSLMTNGNSYPYINHFFRRAPGFFDEVCYTGTGVAQNISHNLTVVPELMIVKERNGANGWQVYSASLTNNDYLILNTTAGVPAPSTTRWNSTTPTSTVFSVGTHGATNGSGQNFVNYLFASCPGVSKVFSYTGNGSSQTINCGFTGGARFVMIKRTDSTGDWYVWDTARGIVANNDPHLSLNSTAAEVTTNDTIDTDSTGFVVNQVAATNVNVSSATYIGLAIA